MVQWHAVTQHTGNQLGIVPIFLVELLGKPFHGGLVSLLVFELEVVTFVAVFVHVLDMRPFMTLFGRTIPSSSS